MTDNDRQRRYKKISKLLSLALRHQPEVLGIQLDGQGWTDTSELIAAVNEHGTPLDMNLLEAVVRENDKQRFAFSKDHSQIRANQGHSLSVDLKLSPSVPPEILYHGTVAKFMSDIQANGLKNMSRQHVHLSVDVATAQKVGVRRGKPIILKVLAGKMHRDDFKFYLSENKVWLTDQVPAEYLQW